MQVYCEAKLFLQSLAIYSPFTPGYNDNKFEPVMSFSACTNLSIDAAHTAAILATQQEEEDAQLLSNNGGFEVNGCSSIDDDETTLWLKYTRWPVTLAGRPLDILSASALRPADYRGDNILGSWQG